MQPLSKETPTKAENLPSLQARHLDLSLAASVSEYQPVRQFTQRDSLASASTSLH